MIDILIPCLRRPQNAIPLALSATFTLSPYRLVFICSPRDSQQISACTDTGAEVMIVDWSPGPADYARKINHGYRETSSEWVFQGADDIRFTEGWDTEALACDKRVIGTNDLHNPSVLRGRGSTHSLIARSYIEELGGTEDGSGDILCELYDHQYVDRELIEVARRRGEFISCLTSVVEHFHPHWGNAERDSTYTKAWRQTGADHRLFRKRLGRVRA